MIDDNSSGVIAAIRNLSQIIKSKEIVIHLNPQHSQKITNPKPGRGTKIKLHSESKTLFIERGS